MGSLGVSEMNALTLDNNIKKGHQKYELDVGLIQRKTVGAIIQKTVNDEIPKVYTPLQIRDVEFPNRIMVAPMCMYSCEKKDGVFTDFHLMHYGNLAIRGTALVIIEATAVEPRGRLSPQCTGLWNEEQCESLKRITRLAHASGGRVGIQLAHGGRKASTYAPFHNFEESGGKLGTRRTIPRDEGGFGHEMVAPSPIPWKPALFPTPHELSIPEIKEIVQKFAEAARRCVAAGIDVIEIHGAHGYLISEFLSGSTNKRTDEYGGSMQNRFKFLLEIIKAIREVIPAGMPLFLRVSGTDFSAEDGGILSCNPNGWDIQQVIELCRQAAPLGLDLIDLSSGGVLPINKGIFADKFGFQLPLAEQVKLAKIPNLLVGAVGCLEYAKLTELALCEDKCDVALIGREFLKNPSLVYKFQEELGVKVRWPSQYSWMWVDPR